MIPSPHNISKLKNQKLQASKSKVHQKISNTFIECAIQKNTVGALKTIYYLSGAIETIENLYKLEKDTLITIKIDISMVRNVDTDPLKQTMIQALVSISKSINAQSIAEGIETVSEYKKIQTLGVDYCQGYLFAKPGPPFSTPKKFI